MSAKARILLVGTGGTIAGSSAAAADRHYQAGVFSVDRLASAVPGLTDRADLSSEQVFDLDSVDLTLDDRVRLARRLQDVLDADDAPDGIVVTHGTDSLEETAYLLHLLLQTEVPVVVTGAMRPADDPGADGPANLADAVAVAASPLARGVGTLVTFGGQVHGAREITKRYAGRLDAFASLHGPMGHIADGNLVIATRPARAYGAASAFRLGGLPDRLPRVETLVSYPELPAEVVRAIVTSGAAGIVHAGPGGGNVPAAVATMLDEARSAGLAIVRSTRSGFGPAPRNGEVGDDAHDWIAAGDLPPYKARILLTLGLTLTGEVARLQSLFDTH